MRGRWWSALLLAAMLTPVLSSAASTWSIHAHAPVPDEDAEVLRETFLSADMEAPSRPSKSATVDWVWWSWSESTGSDWPNDDAIYRQQHFNLSSSTVNATGHRVEHRRITTDLVDMNGRVNVVAAEDNVRFVTFELDITPRVNLSDQTLLYLVLTEDRARDVHHRQVDHLVRELRPEVAFSLKADNTTSMTAMLAADHLAAAGVDLTDQTTGWSYTIALFGGREGSETSDLLLLKHDRLPAPTLHLTAAQKWLPLTITAFALVAMASIVAASSKRERTVPVLKARWTDVDRSIMTLTLEAGEVPFTVTQWSVQPPWSFRGRPPVRTFEAGEHVDMLVRFKSSHDAECHLESSIEIEGFGAWRQHVWLSSPFQRPEEDLESSEAE